jgi:hypothetical protein
LGVALLAAIAWFFWRKRRATPVAKSKEGYELTADHRR